MDQLSSKVVLMEPPAVTVLNCELLSLWSLYAVDVNYCPCGVCMFHCHCGLHVFTRVHVNCFCTLLIPKRATMKL